MATKKEEAVRISAPNFQKIKLKIVGTARVDVIKATAGFNLIDEAISQ